MEHWHRLPRVFVGSKSHVDRVLGQEALACWIRWPPEFSSNLNCSVILCNCSLFFHLAGIVLTAMSISLKEKKLIALHLIQIQIWCREGGTTEEWEQNIWAYRCLFGAAWKENVLRSIDWFIHRLKHLSSKAKFLNHDQFIKSTIVLFLGSLCWRDLEKLAAVTATQKGINGMLSPFLPSKYLGSDSLEEIDMLLWLFQADRLDRF